MLKNRLKVFLDLDPEADVSVLHRPQIAYIVKIFMKIRSVVFTQLSCQQTRRQTDNCRALHNLRDQLRLPTLDYEYGYIYLSPLHNLLSGGNY